MDNTTTPEIRDISYGSLIFRQIDRVLSLGNKDFTDDKIKLFTFKWSVRMLRSSIPKEIIDKTFETKEKEIKWDSDKTYLEQFEEVMKLYSLCIDHLANKGYLYKKSIDGEYDDES